MINFLKYTKLYFLISIIIIGVSFFAIFRSGLRFSIDFRGGSIIEYRVNKPVEKDVLAALFKKQGITISSIEQKDNVYRINAGVISEKHEDSFRSEFQKKYSIKLERLRYETVGPTIGAEMVQKTIIAAVVAMVGILLYVTFAFSRASYGIAAIIALIHDLCVLFGLYALLGIFLHAEIDTLFVTAVLTTMSFSVHDTIVVFDKIREYEKSESGSIAELANNALTSTMIRSLNNSLTIILMLIALTLMGGETVRFFAAALLIGTITGTYSSPFIATPVLVWLENRKNRS